MSFFFPGELPIYDRPDLDTPTDYTVFVFALYSLFFTPSCYHTPPPTHPPTHPPVSPADHRSPSDTSSRMRMDLSAGAVNGKKERRFKRHYITRILPVHFLDCVHIAFVSYISAHDVRSRGQRFRTDNILLTFGEKKKLIIYYHRVFERNV